MSTKNLSARTARLGMTICLLAILFFACSPAPSAPQPPTPEAVASKMPTSEPAALPKVLFDDFSYIDQQKMTENGWIVREKAGWPGVPGATFWAGGVSFVDDPDQAGNRLLQMTSATDGSSANTKQSQFCHQRKYYEGTYATRVKFNDEPTSGPDGDQIVETFYMISPLKAPMDPDYSEMDNEYLPNGGWGWNGPTFFVTTWETAQLEPWVADNASDALPGSMAGWHTLVMQVTNGEVKYYVDGGRIATHGGKYYPEVPMSINYNLWFVNGGLLGSKESRQYNEYVDWVYFEADAVLTPPDVEARVAAMRASSIPFQDTIPAWSPALPSPCDF